MAVTGRDIAFQVIAGLSAAAAVSLLTVPFAARRMPSAAVVLLGGGMTLAAWSAVGWAWYFTGGTVS